LGRDSRQAFTQQLDNRAGNGAASLQTVLGIENGDQLIAAVVATHDGRKGWINRLAVHPDHRGAGHAKRLITWAENSLKEQGINVIAALIENKNVASLALFQQMGYQLAEDVRYLSKRDDPDA
jgi:ribosomal protein S18 acetylase RimI-like enzyme